jgi:hypothetical protein
VLHDQSAMHSLYSSCTPCLICVGRSCLVLSSLLVASMRHCFALLLACIMLRYAASRCSHSVWPVTNHLQCVVADVDACQGMGFSVCRLCRQLLCACCSVCSTWGASSDRLLALLLLCNHRNVWRSTDGMKQASSMTACTTLLY